MSIQNDFSLMSAESRRIELARLLASGLIRLLLRKANDSAEEQEESDQSSDAGLEDS